VPNQSANFAINLGLSCTGFQIHNKTRPGENKSRLFENRVCPEKGTSRTIAKQSNTAKTTFAMNQEKERKKRRGKKENELEEGRT
jgi:hypothetical protein